MQLYIYTRRYSLSDPNAVFWETKRSLPSIYLCEISSEWMLLWYYCRRSWLFGRPDVKCFLWSPSSFSAFVSY